MSRIKLGIRRISPIAPTACVRQKRTCADKADLEPQVARATPLAMQTELRPPRRALALRVIFRLRRKWR